MNQAVAMNKQSPISTLPRESQSLITEFLGYEDYWMKIFRDEVLTELDKGYRMIALTRDGYPCLNCYAHYYEKVAGDNAYDCGNSQEMHAVTCENIDFYVDNIYIRTEPRIQTIFRQFSYRDFEEATRELGAIPTPKTYKEFKLAENIRVKQYKDDMAALIRASEESLNDYYRNLSEDSPSYLDD